MPLSTNRWQHASYLFPFGIASYIVVRKSQTARAPDGRIRAVCDGYPRGFRGGSAAFEEALRHELPPYNLSGRGHEARVSLSARTAVAVRSMNLPRVRISGYGASYFYPERLVRRAAKILSVKQNSLVGVGSFSFGSPPRRR
jgi:hypothetical protein